MSVISSCKPLATTQNLISLCIVVMANILVTSCLFAHRAAEEQHDPSLGVVFVSKSSVFVLHQLLGEISGSSAAKCFTMFTSWSLIVSVCCLLLSRSCTVAFYSFFSSGSDGLRALRVNQNKKAVAGWIKK